MIKRISLIIGALATVSLIACQSMEHGNGQKASASLDSRSGSNAKGTVNFVWQGHDVLVSGNFSGLKPNAEQGFHVHEKGDCTALDATSAGGHFNPDTKHTGCQVASQAMLEICPILSRIPMVMLVIQPS
jgi:Cu-Zn family superoxide dismutase